MAKNYNFIKLIPQSLHSNFKLHTNDITSMISLERPKTLDLKDRITYMDLKVICWLKQLSNDIITRGMCNFHVEAKCTRSWDLIDLSSSRNSWTSWSPHIPTCISIEHFHINKQVFLIWNYSIIAILIFNKMK